MKEDYPFKPDFTEKRYSITITVFKNAIKTDFSFFNDYRPNYHEAIGVIETQKSRWMRDHAGIVQTESEKLNSEQNPERSVATEADSSNVAGKQQKK